MAARNAALKLESGTKHHSPRPARKWNAPGVWEQETERSVRAVAVAGDESLRPADSPVLWEVAARVGYVDDANYVYERQPTSPGADVQPGTTPAFIELTIGHGRGSDEPSHTYRIECELAHLDTLMHALSAALEIARRDGVVPIAQGVPPVRYAR